MLTPGSAPPSSTSGVSSGGGSRGRLAEHQRAAVGLRRGRRTWRAGARSRARPGAGAPRRSPRGGRRGRPRCAISRGPDEPGAQEVRRRHERVGERHVAPAARAGRRRACSRRWACRRARSSGRSAWPVEAVAVGVDGGVGVEEVLGHGRHRPARVGAAGDGCSITREVTSLLRKPACRSLSLNVSPTPVRRPPPRGGRRSSPAGRASSGATARMPRPSGSSRSPRPRRGSTRARSARTRGRPSACRGRRP